MHRRAIYRFRRAARGERSAEAIDRVPQTLSTGCMARGISIQLDLCEGKDLHLCGAFSSMMLFLRTPVRTDGTNLW